ncbi:hypothetical protein LUW75_04660 [Streptomyces sp. MRC013]|nr:hypothetical protein LUW75_04660 [Streptomyces sp. MRC013]
MPLCPPPVHNPCACCARVKSSATSAARLKYASRVFGRIMSRSTSAPAARCSSNGTTTTPRQRVSKCWTMSSTLIILPVSRTPEMTVRERCTSSAYPCAESQSSVVDALEAPSTDGVEMMISWSARSSTPRMAL